MFVGRPAWEGHSYMLRDIVGQFHPWRAFARAQLLEGKVPLWNPYNQGGNPFAANPQTQVFYPPSVLFLWPSFGVALVLYLAAHALIGTLGMYVLLQRWGCVPCACLVGTLTYGYNGWNVTRMEFVPVYASASWVPWAFITLGWCVYQPGFRSIAVTSLVLTTQTLAGNPNNLFICALCYGCFVGMALALLATHSLKRAGLACVSLGTAGLLTAALTAIQLVPLAEFGSLSLRGARLPYGLVTERSVFPAHLITFLRPFAYGTPGYAAYRVGDLHEFWSGSYHVGLLPLALVVVGGCLWVWQAVRRRLPSAGPLQPGVSERRGLAVSAVMMTALGIALALGKHSVVFRLCYEHVPLFGRFRWPCKFMFMSVTGMCLLSGLCADRLSRLLARRSKRVGVVFDWLAVALVVGPLACFGWALNPTAPSELYDAHPHRAPLPDAHRVLCAKASRPLNNYLYGCRQVAAFEWTRTMLLAYANLVEGVDAAHADDPLRLRGVAQVLALAESDGVPTAARRRLIEMLSIGEIRHALDVEPHALYLIDTPAKHVARERVAAPFPRAWLVSTAVLVPRSEIGRLCARGLNPRELVIFPAAERRTVKRRVEGEARVLSRRAHEARVALDVRGRGWLVLNDAAGPGWAAYVDGQARAVRTANFALRAVAVSDGDRRLRFVYRPRSLKWGASSSIAALSLIVLMGCLRVGGVRPR